MKKTKTLVIARSYPAFMNFISATCKDMNDFTFISSVHQLWGYDPDTPLLKIEGYDVRDFPPNHRHMLRMRNQSDFSFESLKPRERKVTP